MPSSQRLFVAMLVLLGLLGAGTFGYMEIEHWNFVDSLFMTAITLSTVGYQTVHPLDQSGKYFTILLIVGGVGTVGYAIATLSELILEGHVYKLLGIRKMDRKIGSLKDHVIVCGYGKIGSLVIPGLVERAIPFVLIEENPQIAREAVEKGYLTVEGNASEEEVLKKAGIERARSLLVTPSSRPADSVYITMSSRLDNPGLSIIALASDPKTESKLLKAGATRVVSPFVLGSHRMLLALTQPTILDVLDRVVSPESGGFVFDEISIPEGSRFDGRTVSEFSQDLGIKFHIIAIQSKGLSRLVLPTAETIISARDQMVVIGTREDILRVKENLGLPSDLYERGQSFETA
ncbi:potassium channel family protein [Leptospirillum ferriphilum]|jgi:voltage-gated potassium channel|uniref:TrkA-N domain protein n=2 Tax=Leptospirillum TaxID=179 RepID=A0A094X7Z7_9BACT|nr:potassium channel protein [Leptospirillum ferriphilum]EDZ40016.1 MAG: Putative potassium channel protein [Leptospirillum sp. Group II '5-way CG']KGA94644.1 TrkA-N domain protein [Leptospirillum ferriphilum]